MIGPAFLLLLLAISTSNTYAETAICEQLIECLAKARARNDECLSSHASLNSRDSKHHCRNETLHNQLKQLTEQRTAHYESCLRTKAPSAQPIENAKKQAKCDAIMRKHSGKRDVPKPRRSTKKDKRKDQSMQKSCFREARKIRLQCSQLAKCCSVSRLCRDTSAIDEKINEKKMEIKEAQRKCRAENNGRKRGRKHKRQQQYEHQHQQEHQQHQHQQHQHQQQQQPNSHHSKTVESRAAHKP